VTTVQVAPFQTSASGDRAPVTVVLLSPTATQWAAELQDTDRRPLNVAGLGVVRTVQVVPFHWAATVVPLVLAWSAAAVVWTAAALAGPAAIIRAAQDRGGDACANRRGRDLCSEHAPYSLRGHAFLRWTAPG
jgi:hypothetical protein